MSSTYSECVLVDLGIQIAMHMRHIVICDLPGSTTFFQDISLTKRLSFKKMNMKMCALIFSTTFVSNSSLSKKN
jgi:hypothetical protein